MPEVNDVAGYKKPSFPKTAEDVKTFTGYVDGYLQAWCGKVSKDISGGPDIEAEFKAGVSSIMVAKAYRKQNVRNKRGSAGGKTPNFKLGG